jgi:hypothetical protein
MSLAVSSRTGSAASTSRSAPLPGQQGNKKASLSGGAIAGIVIAVLVILIAIFAFCLVGLQQRKKTTSKILENVEPAIQMDPEKIVHDGYSRYYTPQAAELHDGAKNLRLCYSRERGNKIKHGAPDL